MYIRDRIETAETAAEKAVAEIEADEKENINKAVEQVAINAVFEKEMCIRDRL